MQREDISKILFVRYKEVLLKFNQTNKHTMHIKPFIYNKTKLLWDPVNYVLLR